MRSASPTTRAPRAPSAQNRGVNTAAATIGSTALSETQLRRRLAEVEMRLRDIDDDAKRVQMHHEQELATLVRDNKKLHDRLEELRMEECMTPAEVKAMQAHMNLSHGTPSKHHHGESRLLGATSTKYQSAKAEVDAKRKECAQAERQLAEVRQQLAELCQRRQVLKQEVFSTRASVGVKIAAAQRYKLQVREQLRGLEEQVAREQERFSNMVVEAQNLRATIDSLLVNQTSNEKMYHKLYDALLDKRKEMAYLMEVCNSLCEERQQVNAELQEMKAHLAEESRQYEAAFHELTGVAEENAAAQSVNREKMEELHRLIGQTKAEREALEALNAETKARLERHRHQHRHRVGHRLNDDGNSNNGKSYNNEHNPISRPSDNDENENENGDASNNTERSGVETSFGSGSSSMALDGNAQQIREFEEYFQKLADIVQSDAIEDVVSFIDIATDERYRCFDEMNALKRDIAELTAEKAALKAQLEHGGTSAVAPPPANMSATNQCSDSPLLKSSASGNYSVTDPVSPTASVAALATANTVAELAAASPSAEMSIDEASSKRAARMRQLQDELDKTRDAFTAQEEQREECLLVISQVLTQVNEVFHGLGCSVVELRSITGLEGVQQSTLLTCLSILEQRAEEYLLAYTRVQHLQDQQHALNVWDEHETTHSNNNINAAASHNAARTVLRRPDLLPKTKGGSALHVATQQLPRSTDVTAAVPQLCIDATHTASLEELVEERPLSDAELREVVEAKRAMTRH